MLQKRFEDEVHAVVGLKHMDKTFSVPVHTGGELEPFSVLAGSGRMDHGGNLFGVFIFTSCGKVHMFVQFSFLIE